MGATIKRAPIDGHILDRLPELRIVSKYTIGVEDVDLDAATARGILVTHCPTEANWGGVAEGTVGFMLTLLKRVRERDRHVKAGGWRDSNLMGTYLGQREDGYSGLTIGIVGLGRCGSRVAELLSTPGGFECWPAIPMSRKRNFSTLASSGQTSQLCSGNRMWSPCTLP